MSDMSPTNEQFIRQELASGTYSNREELPKRPSICFGAGAI